MLLPYTTHREEPRMYLRSYAATMADTQQVGANTVITYDANDTVTLTGVTASHLTASNFKFT